MKLNPDYLKHTVDGMVLVVPTAKADFRGLVKGNKTVGVILDCLEQDMTEEQIVDVLCEKFDGDRDVIRADVEDTVEQLRKIGAVDG